MAKSQVPDVSAGIDDDNDEEWETLGGGLGEEWNFDNGPLTGYYVGTLPYHLNKENRDTLVHQFAVVNDPDTIVFLWGSYNLDTVLADTEKVRVGDKFKISFLGTDSFRDANTNQPRTIKRYRIQTSATNYRDNPGPHSPR